jgi:hypothetical protein
VRRIFFLLLKILSYYNLKFIYCVVAANRPYLSKVTGT